MIRPFDLERYFAAHEFTTPHMFSCSDCETMTVGELCALEPGAASALAATPLGYVDARGTAPLREAIAALYQTMTSSEVLAHAGAEEAIFALVHAAVQPNDRVVAVVPCYASMVNVPASIGAEVVTVPLEEDTGWSLDVDRIIDAMTGARLVIVNFPHNPTGAHLGPDDFAAIVRAAESAGALLLSDEVYRGAEYDPADRLVAACDLSDRAISLGVMSKAFGLAGLRVGWLASHATDWLDRAAAVKDYLTICNAGPSELLAAVALRNADAILARTREILIRNLGALDRFVEQSAELEWVRPSAGPIGLLRTRTDAAALADHVRENAGVLVLPSTVFDHGRHHVRVGFGRRTFVDVLERFGRALTT